MSQQLLRAFQGRHYRYRSILDSRYLGKMVIYVEAKTGEWFAIMVVPRMESINAHKWLASRLDTYLNLLKDMSLFDAGDFSIVIGKNVVQLLKQETIARLVEPIGGEKEIALDYDGLPKAVSKQARLEKRSSKRPIKTQKLIAASTQPLYEPLKADKFVRTPVSVKKQRSTSN